VTTETTITAESYERLNNALNQIATDMLSIKSLLNDMVPEGSFDHRCAAIELLACRSGALADRLNETAGGVRVHGGLEEWFED
jgi:hypothetical protein